MIRDKLQDIWRFFLLCLPWIGTWVLYKESKELEQDWIESCDRLENMLLDKWDKILEKDPTRFVELSFWDPNRVDHRILVVVHDWNAKTSKELLREAEVRIGELSERLRKYEDFDEEHTSQGISNSE